MFYAFHEPVTHNPITRQRNFLLPPPRNAASERFKVSGAEQWALEGFYSFSRMIYKRTSDSTWLNLDETISYLNLFNPLEARATQMTSQASLPGFWYHRKTIFSTFLRARDKFDDFSLNSSAETKVALNKRKTCQSANSAIVSFSLSSLN